MGVGASVECAARSLQSANHFEEAFMKSQFRAAMIAVAAAAVFFAGYRTG
jgi:hypothetical protein